MKSLFLLMPLAAMLIAAGVVRADQPGQRKDATKDSQMRTNNDSVGCPKCPPKKK